MNVNTPSFVSNYYPEEAFVCAVIPNMSSADLNNDGLEDIVFSGWALSGDGNGGVFNQPAYVKIFIQQPDGSLLDQTNQLLGVAPKNLAGTKAGLSVPDLDQATGNIIYGSQRILLGDYDSNGFVDIFLPGFMDGLPQNASSVMFWNEGDNFSRQNFSENVWAHGALSADLNFDGLLDLWAPGTGSGGIYLNKGDRQFDFIYMGESYAAMQLLAQDGEKSTILVTNNYNSGPFVDGVPVGSVDWIIQLDKNLNIVSSIEFPDTKAGTVDDGNIAFLDINHDGNKDLIIGSIKGQFLRIYLADDAGNFTQTDEFSNSISPVKWPGHFNKVFDIDGNLAYFLPGENLYVFTEKGINDYSPQISAIIDKISEFKNTGFPTPDATSYVYQNYTSGKLYVLIYYPYEFWTAQLNLHSPSGSVDILGSVVQGETLTAQNSLVDGDGIGTISYQWLVDGVPIENGVGSTYKLSQVDVGKAISVAASYTDQLGSFESVSSDKTAAVANVNDSPTGAVSISGTTRQGQVLTASNTLADVDGLGTINYQWRADGSNIRGATGSSYTLTQADVGKAISVVASYTDGYGTFESKTSSSTRVITPLETDSGNTKSQPVAFNIPVAQIDSIGLTPDGKSLIVKSNGVSKIVSLDTELAFSDASKSASELTSLIQPIAVFSSIVNGETQYVLPNLFNGPPSLNLKYELIDLTPNAVVKGSSENDFIKVAHESSAGKAVDAGDGDDVIDGGVGSTFVTGGGGSNTFFLDGRAPGTSWSTITDFKLGTDKATIWGWKAGVSRVSTAFTDTDTGGAPGYTGLTLHFENLLPDDAAPGQTNSYLNSITLSGRTLRDFGANSLEELNAQIVSGTSSHFLVGSVSDQYGDHGYLFLS